MPTVDHSIKGPNHHFDKSWRAVLILFLLLELTCKAQPIPPRFASLIIKPRTNSYVLSWERPGGYVIFSNRITQTIPAIKTNVWWVGDVTQTVFSLVVTQSYPRWTIVVAALGLELSDNSVPAYWPPFGPTNRVIEFSTFTNPSGKIPILTKTNPIGTYFVRLHFQPTNSMWTVPFWFSEGSTNLFQWQSFGSMIVAPEIPHLQLSFTNWSY